MHLFARLDMEQEQGPLRQRVSEFRNAHPDRGIGEILGGLPYLVCPCWSDAINLAIAQPYRDGAAFSVGKGNQGHREVAGSDPARFAFVPLAFRQFQELRCDQVGGQCRRLIYLG